MTDPAPHSDPARAPAARRPVPGVAPVLAAPARPEESAEDGAALLRELVGAYLKPADIDKLEAAIALATTAHEGQTRQSGVPYVTHPLAVARILARWHLDAQALIAALLHDVVEDTAITSETIARQFGKPVADLVDGVSKIDKLSFATLEEAQAENFRKMLLAMARDVRVILIKLADRLHNMRTLGAVSPSKQERVAKETLEIYSPIANRLGLSGLHYEFEDLGFKYLHPHRFAVLEKAIKAARGNRREVVGKILESIKKRLAEFKVEATITGREKYISSIYKKMHDKHITFSEVLDIYGFRIIVQDVSACYVALGALHTLYKPVPGKFKDYIAIPKANGYQSLHTTLIGPYGTPVELQIRTADMHKIAEAGVAAHWMYKSLSEDDGQLSNMQQKTHQWLQSLLEIQSGSGDALEFLEHIKVDLFPDEVYVFSPRGKIFSMRKGATPIDFAYNIHSDIGNRAVGARINDEPVPLSTRLKNGDRVEILTDETGRPNAAWLNYAVTGRARAHIRQYLKTRQQSEAVELGELLLVQAIRSLNLDPNDMRRTHWERLLKGDHAKNKEAVLAEIGLGKRLAVVVARKLYAVAEAPVSDNRRPNAIVIRGTEDLAVQFASCCRPIPGDPIIAQLKGGVGLVVHTHDCNFAHPTRYEREKWVDVQWDPSIDRHFSVDIRVMVTDRRGVLAKLAAEITAADSNISRVNMNEHHLDADPKYATIAFTIDVRHRMHLAQVMRALRRLPEVARITRVKSAPSRDTREQREARTIEPPGPTP
ncbi:MAG TPA: bifunctional (p)ppGpp synthetase/guanosine-3',5'-bis(diphosphate) 3'-pyrophosphohydrolase [Usitatibacteraceae bacterium]|nr:bifunctional (p)ppGpp synthetase/guanosine-3',5'-bis(diphosphate) 3'-pyrophosphohydrolase [Usitatibacteraceae bacterium]